METIIAIVFGALGLSGVTAYGLRARARENLIADIRNLLEDCRGLKSWDDRSEYKLMSWVEGDERELHHKSLRELHRIRNSMIKYWQVHLEMQECEEYGELQTEPQSYRQFVLQEVLGLRKRHRR